MNEHDNFVGFDVRLSFEDSLRHFWSEEDRQNFLIRPEIKNLISVDPEIWPSVFVWSKLDFTTEERKFPAIQVDAESEKQTPFGLWQSYEKMVGFYCSSSKNRPKDNLAIGISLGLADQVVTDGWIETVLEPTFLANSIKHQPDWRFKGYDVADRSLISGICNCAYNTEEIRDVRNAWACELNADGLFRDSCRAKQFATFSNLRCSEHKPFYVLGLWLCSRI